jgi:hypothetical protein
MTDDISFASAKDQDFERLARELEPGESMTDEDWAAARRIVNTYWPRFRPPRPLPERWL